MVKSDFVEAALFIQKSDAIICNLCDTGLQLEILDEILNSYADFVIRTFDKDAEDTVYEKFWYMILEHNATAEDWETFYDENF